MHPLLCVLLIVASTLAIAQQSQTTDQNTAATSTPQATDPAQTAAPAQAADPVTNTAPRPASPPTLTKRETASATDAMQLTLPSGTKVPLVLKHAITTKTAKEGDAIYAETNFPVVQDGRIAIPPGTYVQGVISRITRPGRVKGRAELLVHFTSMIFPSGYTVLLPGAVDNVPGQENQTVKDKEGTVGGGGAKGKDAGTIATNAGTGAAIGALATRSGSGTAIGGAAGLAVGLATVLFTRGPDVRLESGTTVEMVLERAVTIDRSRSGLRN
jgi:hypothetical protein